MDELARELQALGYKVDLSRRDLGVLILRGFQILAGREAGKLIDVGFPASDYPNTPPSAVHFTPELPPPAQGHVQPTCPLGPGWTYWSRKIDNWSNDRSAKRIITWLNSVFYYG
jgi:hypothetical protein